MQVFESDYQRIDLASMRVVEIGQPYVKYVIPNTRCFASPSTARIHGTRFESIANLSSALRDPNLNLVVCHAPQYSPWSPNWWIRSIAHRRVLKGNFAWVTLVAPQFLRLKTRVPLMIIDLEDTRYIPSSATFLLDRCTTWFKRELPLDRWQVFMRTDHPNLPTFRYRNKTRNRRRIEKLYPLSLGTKLGTEELFPASPIQKSSDLFFAGTVVGSSFVRERGLSSLRKLQSLGYRVDIAEHPISQKEFYDRAASAHLVWSPEGYGWDCFRHYETAMCWSVPLINHATIERHMPMRHGEHALYYHPDGDDFVRVVESALANRKGLMDIAAKARAHVMRHNLQVPSVQYMIHTTLRVPFH